MTDMPAKVDPASSLMVATNFRLTPTCLYINGKPDKEEWEEVGKTLNLVERASHWAIGDWLRYGDKTYGANTKTAEVLGIALDTANADKWVAGQIEPCRRRQGLSHAHHKDVLGIADPAEQDKMLDRAEANDWNREKLRQAVKRFKGEKSDMDVHYTSDSPEWYTPPDVIAAVVAALGGTITLDPCSNSEGEPNVPATNRYTEVDDGLAQAWAGTVYMNPPYGRVIGEWTDKLKAEYENGDVVAGIALLPARTDTQWCHALRDYPRCFIVGRLTFSNADTCAPFPSMAVYLGDRVDLFKNSFGKFGDTYYRVC